MYPEAAKAAVRVTDPSHAKHVSNLLAVIAFEQDNLPGGRRCRSAAGLNSYDVYYTAERANTQVQHARVGHKCTVADSDASA